ncbi:MAG TPA: HEAT repeat domain-containing protein [Anaerohalosphaeraceae bacterium]|nr:HEAT repeat domain-containing protein [Anaerohalosphaeraceae bacterium]
MGKLQKKVFIRAGLSIVLLEIVFSGCAKKGKAASDEKEVQTALLQKQIQTLRSELESVQKELEAERQTSLELAEMLRHYREGGGQGNTSSAEPSAAASVQTSGGAEVLLSKTKELTEEIQRLKEENSRLAGQVRTLKALRPPVPAVEEQKPTSAPVEVYAVGESGNQTIKDAYALFQKETASSERLAALESMQELALEQEPELIGLLEKALEDPDPEVVRTAAQMLEPYRNPAVLPLIEKALRSRDEEVRLSVLGPLEEIEDPRCAELAVMALSDPSDTVRGCALDVIRGQSPDIQILSLSRAIGLASDEVKSEVLSLLELRGDKAAVEVMFNGLKDPNPEFREEVKSVLRLLLNQEFSSYNQAMRWWKANHSRYDDNLLEQ